MSERETAMDEQIIEVMAKAVHGKFWQLLTDVARHDVRESVRRGLAALRAEGFDIYRPGDCGSVTVEEGHTHVVFDLLPGTYRLVPAERGE